MRWFAGGILAVIGVVFIVLSWTEPTGRHGSHWRWTGKVVLAAVGAGLITAGIYVAGTGEHHTVQLR